MACTPCGIANAATRQHCQTCGRPLAGDAVRRQRREQLELFAAEPAKVTADVGRVGLIKELQRRVRASSDVPLATRIALRAALEALKTQDADDTRGIVAWRSLRDGAPRVWQASGSIRDVLIGETVKRALDLD